MSDTQQSNSLSDRAEGQVDTDYPVRYFPPHIILAAQGDEISLTDVFRLLGRKRNLILGVVGISILASLVFAFLIPPVYQATIHFLPPLRQDIDALNVSVLGTTYTPVDVYGEFQSNFMARNNLWDFFMDKQLYRGYLDNDAPSNEEISQAFEKKFLHDLKLNRPRGSIADKAFVSATLEWPISVEGAALLNGYSQMVIDRTTLQFVNELNSEIQLSVERLEKNIESLRSSSEVQNKRQLAILEENITIARSLDLKRAGLFEPENTSSGIIVDTTNNQAVYNKGYEVLEAEKAALLNRKNNDPFIPELVELIKQQEYLGNLAVQGDEIEVVRITQPASASSIPVKPRKKLIVIFGGILGLVAGVMLAFVTHLVSTQRKS